MKNIHVLPTEKPSRLGYLTKKGKEVYKDLRLFDRLMPNILDSENQHIYITSDEEITGFENNIWVIKGNRIFLWQNTMALVSNNKPKKIILTTDEDLINGGVQSIDDDFLEWFVKNPSCEEVGVSYEVLKPFQSENKGYLIHCPDNEVLEESKQETLNKTNNMTAVEQVIFDLFDGNPPQWAKLIIKEGLEKEKEQMIAFAEYTSIIDQEKSDMKEVLDFYLTLGEEIVEDETPNEQIEMNQEEPKQETLEEVDEKNLKNKNK